MWEGQTAFLLGGGPGLNDVNLDLIKHRRIIGINNAYGDPIKDEEGKTKRRGELVYYEPRSWVDIVWFSDSRWFVWHRESLEKFSGLIAHSAPRQSKRLGLAFYKWGKRAGIDPRPSYIAHNKSAGGGAINFAFHLGVKRVVLLGYDMRRVGGKPNWHDDHPSPDKDPYWRFLRVFPLIARDAKRYGLDIINCTPGSAIDAFPIMHLEEYLRWEEANDL